MHLKLKCSYTWAFMHLSCTMNYHKFELMLNIDLPLFEQMPCLGIFELIRTDSILIILVFLVWIMNLKNKLAWCTVVLYSCVLLTICVSLYLFELVCLNLYDLLVLLNLGLTIHSLLTHYASLNLMIWIWVLMHLWPFVLNCARLCHISICLCTVLNCC